jgi:UDP-N-acetylmuramoyl-L-alanyl-D-glutamate--2,6-diaminopimelate ligase
MRLSAFTGRINRIGGSGSGDPDITGLAYDSRRVEVGYLFFALPGIHVDGHDFIPQAVLRGARGIIHSRDLDQGGMPGIDRGVSYIRVPDTRKAMSSAADEFYGNPSRRLRVVGVTGTDGKSTTVFFIRQLLELAGYKAGFLSTVHYSLGDEVRANPFRQSTPEAVEIHRILAETADAGNDFAVVEATSHGLSERTARLEDVRFVSAVFTNISHEHLEFHGTFERYLSDKSRLFAKLDEQAAGDAASGTGSFGVVNAADPASDRMRAVTSRPVYGYRLENDGTEEPAGALGGGAEEYPELTGRVTEQTAEEISLTVEYGGRSASAVMSMPGAFNAENGLAALLTVSRLVDADPLELAPLLSRLEPVPGRMNPVKAGQPFTVLVDYAHTPGSFSRLFPLMRKRTSGRLIAVFGSAGERDREKRPVQGRIAGKFADLLVLTDEDPRGEEPLAVIREIAAGVEGKTEGEDLLLVPDRNRAIAAAFRAASPGDTVLLLGKGHESTIIYADGPIPWNEADAARRALELLGYRE